jgi:hypothetical protein
VVPREIEKHKDQLMKKLEYDKKVAAGAIQSIKQIAPNIDETINPLINGLMKHADEEYNHAKTVLSDLALKRGSSEIAKYEPKDEKTFKGDNKVPKKLYRGPLSSRPWIAKLSKEDKEAFRAMNKKHKITYGGPATLALYWTDGSKSISEISKHVELESGTTNLEYLVEYYGFLEKMGLVSFVTDKL